MAIGGESARTILDCPCGDNLLQLLEIDGSNPFLECQAECVPERSVGQNCLDSRTRLRQEITGRALFCHMESI